MSSNKEKRTILIIDDEESFREILAETLKHHGCIVHQAQSAAHMFTLLEDVHPDLLLVDIIMPGYDGPMLIRHLRSFPGLSTVPIVAISATAQADDRSAAIACGADAYLPKPFLTRQLLTTISDFLPVR